MTDSSPEHDIPTATGPKRWLLLGIGVLTTALGGVGAFLPVLPTTPFLLVAAACFARSSPAFHRRLLANRVFGPYIIQWRQERTVPREAKRKAYGLVLLSFTISIALIDTTWVRWTLVGVGTSLIVLLACLPTAPDEKVEPQSPDADEPPRTS